LRIAARFDARWTCPDCAAAAQKVSNQALE
jgi:rubredoxin